MRGAEGAGAAANAMVAIMLGRYIYSYIYLIFLAYMCLTVHMPFPESTQLSYYLNNTRDKIETIIFSVL